MFSAFVSRSLGILVFHPKTTSHFLLASSGWWGQNKLALKQWVALHLRRKHCGRGVRLRSGCSRCAGSCCSDCQSCAFFFDPFFLLEVCIPFKIPCQTKPPFFNATGALGSWTARPAHSSEKRTQTQKIYHNTKHRHDHTRTHKCEMATGPRVFAWVLISRGPPCGIFVRTEMGKTGLI